VQIVKHYSWGKLSVAPPFDGTQGDHGVVYLSREKTFSHLYRMIASTLDLKNEESYAVKIIYHGLLVGRPSGCNSPTFNKSPEGRDDPPHVDVKINFTYLEWKYIVRQIPIDNWIWEIRYTREAQLFAEGELKLVPNTWNFQLGAYDIVYATTHHWHHRHWDHIANEWLPHYTNPDSHPMQAYTLNYVR
jgi:hypothetical protein